MHLVILKAFAISETALKQSEILSMFKQQKFKILVQNCDKIQTAKEYYCYNKEELLLERFVI